MKLCRACEVEVELGTKEVPHPVDRRVHTCKPKCSAAFLPGVLNPPGNPMPRARTRCSFDAGHEGEHSFMTPERIEWLKRDSERGYDDDP